VPFWLVQPLDLVFLGHFGITHLVLNSKAVAV
jgi:hypothetical protein